MALAESKRKKMTVLPPVYSVSAEIETLGNVSPRQMYDANTDEYSPDYTVSSLRLMPNCRLVDPDSPDMFRQANTEDGFTFQWLEVNKTGTSLIYPTGDSGGVKSGYEVVTAGDSKGLLTVKSNTPNGGTRSVRFIGRWTDPQSGYVYTFRPKDIGLVIDDATDVQPVLSVDCSRTHNWNPFRHAASQTVRALILAGSTDITDSKKVKLWWYRVNGSARQEITGSADTDWDIASVTKGTNGGQITAITINRDMMGDGSTYEVRAAYRASGSLPASPADTDMRTTFSLVRLIPPLQADVVGSGFRLPVETAYFYCSALVGDNRGDIPDWQKVAAARWFSTYYTSGEDGTLAEHKTLMGEGDGRTLPVREGDFLKLEVEDMGPFALLADENGALLTDEGGNVLIGKSLVLGGG